LSEYTIQTTTKSASEIQEADFVLSEDEQGNKITETSLFNNQLTSEEINILAILMMISWVQRQITSIENTRMKYSGSDFKFTS
jgi:hypothetical protein